MLSVHVQLSRRSESLGARTILVAADENCLRVLKCALQYDLPELFTARERVCKESRECGFQSLFGQYIDVDARSQLSVINRACQKLRCGVVEGIV